MVRNPVVLFVDDEPNILRALRRLVMDESWETYFADNAAEALELLKQRPFDMVVSDVRMPFMDGIAFLRQVQKCYPQVIRIFLSGYAEKNALSQALSEGVAQQLFPKPWKDEEMLSVLRQALERAPQLSLVDEGLPHLLYALPTLPKIPEACLKIREHLESQDELSMERISAAIEGDPSISADLLRWANSALFGSRGKVDTVQRALLVLGLDIAQALILSESLVRFFPQRIAVEGFSLQGFKRHSLGCALLGRLIIRYHLPGEEELAAKTFTAGVLHDIGKLVESGCFPERFEELIRSTRAAAGLLIDAENTELGANHQQVGCYLAEWWNLPGFVLSTVRWHHNPKCAHEHGKIVEAIHVANVLVQRFGVGESGNSRVPEIDEGISECFRFSEEQIEAFRKEFQGLLPG